MIATASTGRSASMTWRRLLRIAGVANATAFTIVGLALRDRETVAFAALMWIALLLVRLRGGVAGVVMIAVLAADAAVWMVPATAANLANREELMDIMIPASLAVISLTASVAAVASIIRRRRPEDGGRAARIVAQTAIAVLVIATGAALAQRGTAEQAQAGDLVVEMHSASFSIDPSTSPPGTITVAVANKDLFWHTFTIDVLGVDVGLPTGGERRVTFGATPGRYEYYCAVPGHALIGMKGTLIVS